MFSQNCTCDPDHIDCELINNSDLDGSINNDSYGNCTVNCWNASHGTPHIITMNSSTGVCTGSNPMTCLKAFGDSDCITSYPGEGIFTFVNLVPSSDVTYILSIRARLANCVGDHNPENTRLRVALCNGLQNYDNMDFNNVDNCLPDIPTTTVLDVNPPFNSFQTFGTQITPTEVFSQVLVYPYYI